MKQLLKRQDLNEVVKWYKSADGPQAGRDREEGIPAGGSFVGVNFNSEPIMPGYRVAVKSFWPANISYKRAYKQLYNGRLKLSLIRSSRGFAYGGTALNPANSKGRVFNADFPAGFFAIASGSGAYLNADGTTADVATATTTAFILARSEPQTAAAAALRVVFASALASPSDAAIQSSIEQIANRIIDERLATLNAEEVEFVEKLEVVGGSIEITTSKRFFYTRDAQ